MNLQSTFLLQKLLWVFGFLLLLGRVKGILIHKNSQLFLVLIKTDRENTVELQANTNISFISLRFLNLQFPIHSSGLEFVFTALTD